jgi:membrane protease YdiL (CAAX protease family)
MSSFRAWVAKNKEWLTDFRPGKSVGEKFSVIVTVLLLNLLYIWGIISLLKFIFSQEKLAKYIYWGWASGQNVPDILYVSLIKSLALTLFFAVVLAPLWEELVFRAYWFWKKLRKRDKEEMLLPEDMRLKLGRMPIWDFVIFSSIIFGIAHGGPINILIQGVGGMFLSYVFLRNGRSYWSAVVLHALYNLTIILIAYNGSKSAIYALTMPYWLTWF